MNYIIIDIHIQYTQQEKYTFPQRFLQTFASNLQKQEPEVAVIIADYAETSEGLMRTNNTGSKFNYLSGT